MMQMLFRMVDFIYQSKHMRGNANGAWLFSNAVDDILFNPPHGISTEFVSEVRVEFVNGTHKSEIAFLHDIVQRNSAVAEFLCDTDYEAQVVAQDFMFKFRKLLTDLEKRL